ncbi:MAG: hypothetical protein IJ770_03550 [Alphaproteobacteria bacterium]|nr:hypothetical protein [Alphaproteobacteria bacterium]
MKNKDKISLLEQEIESLKHQRNLLLIGLFFAFVTHWFGNEIWFKSIENLAFYTMWICFGFVFVKPQKKATIKLFV